MSRERKLVFLVTFFLFFASAGTSGDDEISELLDLWDYSDPAASELLFVSLSGAARQSDNADYLPILITQLARINSMRGRFKLANEQLDQAKSLIADQKSLAWVFLLLERGRTHNSAGSRLEAVDYFKEAFRTAEIIGDDCLAVDAAHMVAIAETLENQMKWNVIALGIAERSKNERARDWLGSLYNNMAWTFFDQEEHEKALDLFEKAVEFRRSKDKPKRLAIARWAVARTFRELERLDAALEIQHSLLSATEDREQPADGYVVEELAELYLLKNDPAASDFFARAYAIMSADEWLEKNEPKRLLRLKKMAVRH